MASVMTTFMPMSDFFLPPWTISDDPGMMHAVGAVSLQLLGHWTVSAYLDLWLQGPNEITG